MSERMLSLGRAVVDLVMARLTRDDGEVVSLTTREAELLGYLAERAGEDVPRAQLLTDVWRYRSTNPTRAVDVAVRRLRSKIEPDPAKPRFLISVSGVGYRLVPDAHVATPMPPPRTVVAPTSVLVGRREELGRVLSLLAAGQRVLTLHGPAGVGKTRLAEEVLFAADPRWPSRIRCDLAACTTTADLVQSVAHAFGLSRAASGDDAAATHALGKELARRGPTLVLLDNVEHLDGAAQVVATWTRLARELSCLITSRARLGLTVEQVVELHPLPRAEAVAMFRSLAGPVDEGVALERLVDRLEGMPLAIELAARLHTWVEIDALAERLARPTAYVSGDAEGRHSSVGAALSWSWDHLDAWERRALAWCAVFRGGFDLDAAEAVLSQDDPDAPWVIDLMQALVDKSLVSMTDGRFSLLESVRVFAEARLAERHELVDARLAHADHYLEVGAELLRRFRRAGGTDSLADLATERANLMAIVRGQLDPERTVRAILALSPLSNTRGASSERRELVELAVELATRTGDPDLEIQARAERADYRVQVDRGGATDDLMRVLELTEGGRLPWWRGQALITLGIQRTVEGLPERALACHAEASRVAAELGNQLLGCHALNQLGYALHRAGRVDEATEAFERALGLSERVADVWVRAMVLGNFAVMLMETGQIERGMDLAQASVDALVEVDDQRLLGKVHTNYAVTLARAARWADAEHHLRASLAIHRADADPHLRAYDLATLGHLLTHQGRLVEADAALAEAFALVASTHSGRLGTLTRYLGILRQHQGRLDEAVDLLKRALDQSRAAGHALGVVSAAVQLGMAHGELGQVEEAVTWVDRAFALAQERHQLGMMPLLRAYRATALSLSPSRVAEARAALDETSEEGSTWLTEVLAVARAHVELAETGARREAPVTTTQTAELALLRRMLEARQK